MGSFPDNFSATKSSSESTKSRGEPGLDLVLRLENFVMTGACLSSREERVVL